MDENNSVKLIYLEELTDLILFEIKQKGYVSFARVELPDGKQYSVYFYDPASLASEFRPFIGQDWNTIQKYIAEPGLIVIPEVTIENMQNAVDNLFEDGYFEHLKPLN